MSETQPPNDQEISLADIDSLLETEDPEFKQAMAEVRAVESDASVSIEASSIVEIPEGVPDDRPEGLRFRIKRAIFAWFARRRVSIVQFAAAIWQFLKTKPKALASLLGQGLSVLHKTVKAVIAIFSRASRVQKFAALILLTLAIGIAFLLRMNLQGVWLPPIEPPILKDLSEVASDVETFDAKEKGESFYRAFPRERNDYLFPKMKVNLRRTPENPVPMGAFELVAELDSKETAIEMREREVEFSDLVQRIFEEQSFSDLASDLGKQKLKSQIKRELDNKLTQGYVRDIDFKTFILKP